MPHIRCDWPGKLKITTSTRLRPLLIPLRPDWSCNRCCPSIVSLCCRCARCARRLGGLRTREGRPGGHRPPGTLAPPRCGFCRSPYQPPHEAGGRGADGNACLHGRGGIRGSPCGWLLWVELGRRCCRWRYQQRRGRCEEPCRKRLGQDRGGETGGRGMSGGAAAGTQTALRLPA